MARQEFEHVIVDTGSRLDLTSTALFEPDATIALPTAKIAVMGPEAAVNAVFANKIAAIDDIGEREAFIAAEREVYEADVDLLRLASELVVDAVVEFADRGTVTIQWADAFERIPLENVIPDALQAQLTAFAASVRTGVAEPEAASAFDAARALEAALALRAARKQLSWRPSGPGVGAC